MAKETKERILKIAQKLFSRKGYDGCSVDLIASEAQVNKATIYYHYKDKASLYEKVLEENLGRFFERVQGAVTDHKSPDKQLEAFATAYAANFVSNKAMAPLMLRELAADGEHLSKSTRKIFRKIIQLVDNILKEGHRVGLFRETKTFLPYFMIVGSMNIHTSTTRMRKKFQGKKDKFGFSLSPEETAREIINILIHGLKK